MAAGWAAGYEATEKQHATVNDGVWHDIVDRNARLSAVIGAMDPAEREAIRAAVLDGFAPYRGADGDYCLPAENLAVLARKPS